MSSEQTPAYTATARVLHWLTAAGVLLAVPIGIVMFRIPGGPLQNALFDLHRSLGVVLFVLIVVRLAWRLTHKPAPLPDDIPMIQKFVAEATHVLLYAILLVTPIVGWIGTSAFGAPIFVFGLFQLPPIVDKDKATADLFLHLHQYIGWALTVLLVMHIGGALFHHFVKRDTVLLRMLRG